MSIVEEEDLKLGREELETLAMMFKRWVKADFNWAVEVLEKQGSTREEDEWDFLRREWIDKLENWIGPRVRRLFQTEYITESDVRDFGNEAAIVIRIALSALYALGGNNKNE